MEDTKSKTSTYTFRVDEDTKKAFEKCAKEMDETGSQILRKHMKAYIAWYMKNNAQQELPNTGKGKK